MGLGASFFTPLRRGAVQVNGAITFAGSAKFDTNSLATATRVNTFRNVAVMSEDGDFPSFVSDGDATTMSVPYVFVPSTPTPALWIAGGFTFDLATTRVVLQNADFSCFRARARSRGTDFNPTPGFWSFTAQSPSANGVFSFSSSGDFNGVPDVWTTVALPGLGLACVELLRSDREFLNS